MKPTCQRCGDYLLPDLGLDERGKQPLGKYGMHRMNYLKAPDPSCIILRSDRNTKFAPQIFLSG